MPTNVHLVGWENFVCKDLTLEQRSPPLLILLEVLDEGVKEAVSMRISAKLVPDVIWEPLFADIGQHQRILKAGHCLHKHVVLNAAQLALTLPDLYGQQEGE